MESRKDLKERLANRIDLRMFPEYLPSQYPDIVGQPDCIDRLRTFVDFYRANHSIPEHVLIVGDEGMGKRTIACAAATALNAPLQQTTASALQINGDLSAILTNLRYGGVLVIEDISGLRRNLQDLLLQCMRTRRLDICIGLGSSTRVHTIEVHPFTLIGTAKKKFDCSPDLLSSFSLVLSLQPYALGELEQITQKIATQANLEIEPEAKRLIAINSGSRPQQADVLMQRVARAVNKPQITSEDVRQALTAFGMNGHTNAQTVSPGILERMSGIDFERLVTTLLETMEFRAEMTKATGDGGIDIVAILDRPIVGGKYLFQCKRYAENNLIGAATVREFYGAVTAERCVKGVFITTSDFTAQAREFAERVGVELIDLAGLQKLLVQSDMGPEGVANHRRQPDRSRETLF